MPFQRDSQLEDSGSQPVSRELGSAGAHSTSAGPTGSAQALGGQLGPLRGKDEPRLQPATYPVSNGDEGPRVQVPRGPLGRTQIP